MTHRDLGFDYSFGTEDEGEELLPNGIPSELSEPPAGAVPESVEPQRQQKENASLQAERILVYLGNLLKKNPAPVLLTDQHLNREDEGYAGVPAGYTYLYQFAAHDMTHSALEARPLGGPSNPQSDLRREALVLETLFGGGPSGCRHAYDMRNANGAYPLRLGHFRDPVDQCVRLPPSRDLPRAYFSKTGARHANCRMSDVLIADPRNDDNNLLAQLTVLFSRLYNVLVKKTETEAKIPMRDRAILARLATIRIYRRILRVDLMGRLMQEDIREAYSTDKRPVLLRATDPPVSREFRFAASRLAHSMVRPKYTLNASDNLAPVGLTEILNMSSLRATWGSPPTPRNWMIDWEFFFKFEQSQVADDQFNWALKFGPLLAPPLTLLEADTPLKDEYPPGVSMRDLLRANLGKTECVASLLKRAWKNGARFKGFDCICDDQARLRMVDEGLAALEVKADAATSGILQGLDRCVLVTNPPLLLYLMIEAQVLGKGRTHGPLGSILVGDAFLPVFEDEDQSTKMAQDAADLEASVFGQGNEIATMPDLITNLDSVEELDG